MDEYDDDAIEVMEAEDYEDDNEGVEDVEFVEIDEFEEDDDEDEAAEFIPGVGMAAGAYALNKLRKRRRRRVPRARPMRSYTMGSKGRRYGVVKTPAGTARIKLPGRFPTMSEFQRSVRRIQQDIKKNSAGIKSLETAEKGKSYYDAKAAKALEKRVFGLQLAVVGLAALSLPQARDLFDRLTN